MTDDSRGPADTSGAEAFLERWSRRKSRARTGETKDEEDGAAPASAAPAEAPAKEGGVPAELPDLDSLDENSDYSAFLAPQVSESLRRKALRKLFLSPKFNVCDGLDDYCEDFTNFDKLGDIVTADMRHQLERAAQQVERLAQAGEPPAPRAASDDDEQPAAEERPRDDDLSEPA